jgi:glycosyltransferase involved in cell wall biosynthesis
VNRATVNDIAQLTPSLLPPRGSDGRTRVLFLTSTALGFATYEKELRRFTAVREDIDAVHIALRPNRLMKLAGLRVPGLGKWDFQSHRYMRMWGTRIASWFRSRIDPECFDVVHVTTENNALALPGIKARTGLPFSVYVDTTTALFCREFGHSPATGAPNRAAERRIFAAADLVACMNNWARQSVHADYGVPESRTMLARSAIDLPSVGGPAGARSGLVRLVYVGNDWVRKGGPRLVEWHQKHFAERAELHLIGKGIPGVEGLKNVISHGAVAREKLLGELLPTMDVFVLPTREDMTPWAIVEAQALRLPVISSRVGAIGELVVHGKTGLLAARDDDAAFVANIGTLIDNGRMRAEMALAAREHAVTEFEPSRWYNGLLDRLKVVAAGSRR